MWVQSLEEIISDIHVHKFRGKVSTTDERVFDNSYTSTQPPVLDDMYFLILNFSINEDHEVT